MEQAAQATKELIQLELIGLSLALKPYDHSDDNLSIWERSFTCLSCLNYGRLNFTYIKSSTAGESYCCDECHSILVASFRPKTDV